MNKQEEQREADVRQGQYKHVLQLSACCSSALCVSDLLYLLSFFILSSVFDLLVSFWPSFTFWVLLPFLCLLVLFYRFPSVLLGSFCPLLSAAPCLWCVGTAGSQPECSQSGAGGQHPAGERCSEDKPSCSWTGNKPIKHHLDAYSQTVFRALITSQKNLLICLENIT